MIPVYSYNHFDWIDLKITLLMWQEKLIIICFHIHKKNGIVELVSDQDDFGRISFFKR